MPVIILLIGLGAYLYYQDAQKFKENYKIRFIDAVFDKNRTGASFFTKIYFTIRFEVINETDFVGKLQSAVLNIFYNGKQLGATKVLAPVTIVKKGVTRIELPVMIPTLMLIDSVATIVTAIKNKSALTFNIKGDLNFLIGKITVNEVYKINLA